MIPRFRIHRALPVAFVLLSAALVHTACRGELEYSTRALYEAPASGFRVLAVGSGMVPAGADIADAPTGLAWICPIDQGLPVRLAFSNSGTVVTDIGDGSFVLDWSFRDRLRRVAGVLATGGYPQPDSAELAEALDVIEGVLLGPKAVTLDGQAEVLTVVETESHYDDRFAVRLDTFSCADRAGD